MCYKWKRQSSQLSTNSSFNIADVIVISKAMSAYSPPLLDKSDPITKMPMKVENSTTTSKLQFQEKFVFGTKIAIVPLKTWGCIQLSELEDFQSISAWRKDFILSKENKLFIRNSPPL